MVNDLIGLNIIRNIMNYKEIESNLRLEIIWFKVSSRGNSYTHFVLKR